VLNAPNGKAALALVDARPQRIDLLITDLVMPDMGGRQLAEAIRRRQPSVPVLFISGYTSSETLRLEGEAHTFLAKPFGPSELLRRARELLDRQ
jgi:DNA-binding response OmpR family regulator